MKNYNAFISGTVMEPLKELGNSGGVTRYRTMIENRRRSGNVERIPLIVEEQVDGFHHIREGNEIFVCGFLNRRNRRSDEPPFTEVYVSGKEIYQGSGKDTNTVRVSGTVRTVEGPRNTPKGTVITEVLVSVPRYQGSTDSFMCICWGDDAEKAGQFQENDAVAAEGRIQSREYGEGKTAYEISVRDISRIQ